jgi:hypothetical protein
MKCSRSEFLNIVSAWCDSICAVHIHTSEISGVIVVELKSVSSDGALRFSSQWPVEPLTVDLSKADEFEFAIPERETNAGEAELVRRISDEMLFARVAGKLLFSMTRLNDHYAALLISR